MAWTRITYFTPVRRSVGAVMSLKNAVAEALESSDPGAVSTNSCPFREDGIVRIHAAGDVWVNTGPAPVAAEGTGMFMAAGEFNDFAVNKNDKVAVIDA